MMMNKRETNPAMYSCRHGIRDGRGVLIETEVRCRDRKEERENKYIRRTKESRNFVRFCAVRVEGLDV